MDELSIILPRLTKDSVVVEVGANNGQHTDLFANIARKVIAFEAHPLFTGSHVCQLHSNVKWVQKAVSNKIGKATFHLSTSDDGSMINSSSLLEISQKSKEWWPNMSFYSTEVETTTLDQEVSDGAVDLIWMDVQGAELEVLQGATETLRKTRMVSVEFHEDQYVGASSIDTIRKLLLTCGFLETVIAGDRSVFIRE